MGVSNPSSGPAEALSRALLGSSRRRGARRPRCPCAGLDTLSYAGSSAGVTVDLSAGTASGGDADGDSFSGFEHIQGSDYDDTLFGDTSPNAVIGGGGNDLIYGGEAPLGSHDDLFGGDGDDFIVAYNFYSFANVFGGAGTDTASYEFFLDARIGGELSIDLALGTVFSVFHGNGSISGVENVIGSRGLDRIRGDAQANTLYGGANYDVLEGRDGDDVLYGGGLADMLYGGAGNDSILGGAFTDSLFGGAGTGDTVGYAGSAAVSVDLGAGTVSGGDATGDTIDGFENAAGGSDGDTLTGAVAVSNTLFGGGGDDTLRGVSDAGATDFDLIYGGDGADLVIFTGSDALGDVYGGTGIDLLDLSGATEASGFLVDLATGQMDRRAAGWGPFTVDGVENVNGSAGDDVLVGDTAANTLIGGGGADVINGGDGIDVLVGGAGADVLHGGGSLDWAGYFDAPGPLTINLATPALSSAYFGEDTLISIEIIGGASNFSNTFEGDGIGNIFIGGAAADSIAGGGGGDLLQGGAGNDTIMGEVGTDAVMGNKGDDILYGGAEADGFYFQDNDGDDVIWDFDVAVDKFVFISATFNGIADLSFSEVGGNAVITYGSATITVEGVTQAQIDSDASLYQWF